jgi:YVTN family beta-propeller protein
MQRFTITLFFSLLLSTLNAQLPNPVLLPNGWSLTPAGRHVQLGDLPLQMVISPDGRLGAITNNGVGKQSIQLIDLRSEAIVHTEPIAKAWYGLAFSADGQKLYASGGNDNLIAVFKVANNALQRDTTIRLDKPWPKAIGPAGIALYKNKLFLATRFDSSLYVCNTDNYTVERRIKLESPAYGCTMSPKGNALYVSLWGAKKVAVFNAKSLDNEGFIEVGDHPNEMITTRKGRYLFVANANDNSVSVVDTRTQKVLEVLDAAVHPGSLCGSTTNSLALSADENTLYIANADNNCLAVFDVSEPGESRSKGFIPTGWYPTGVRVANDKILVISGKGMNSAPNPKGPNPTLKAADSRGSEYIGSLFLGNLSFIGQPDEATAAAYSKAVFSNTPYSKTKEQTTEGEVGNPIPMRVGDPSPIRYVFYIIKENRTYDQVLGDMPEGNGDPALCLFPENITPNQHALAREFVLLDNFYVNAEVSADGHNWSMGAYATDYVEKTWPTSYGGRGGKYDFEGSSLLAYPKSGYIWDNCKRSNISYRTYGEFADGNKANYATLKDHFCPSYASWDMNIQDVERERSWQQDFDSLLAIGQVPRFNTLRFGNDHTSGMRKGAYSPSAAVADNDLAVGRFVEHLSNSPIWKESAVFILEDDAQNGADHVDAHRSIAFVAGGFVRRGFVDHTMYTTASMLRTMELILGMPPMTQYDAAATPMWRCFSSTPDLTPWKARTNQVSIDTRNVSIDELSRRSETFNLVRLDAVPERAFNEVLWKAIKGIDSEMPAPRHSAFVMGKAEED